MSPGPPRSAWRPVSFSGICWTAQYWSTVKCQFRDPMDPPFQCPGMRRGITLGISGAVNRDKPRMHGMGGTARTGARGHEITVNVHLSGHLGHRARHGRHILNPEADGGRARGVRTRRQQSRQHQKHRICRQHSNIHDSSLDYRGRAGKQISSQNSLFHPFRNTAPGKREILKKAPAHSHPAIRATPFPARGFHARRNKTAP